MIRVETRNRWTEIARALRTEAEATEVHSVSYWTRTAAAEVIERALDAARRPEVGIYIDGIEAGHIARLAG